MSDFKLDPANILVLAAKRMAQLSEDPNAASKYLDAACQLDANGGLAFQHALKDHGATVQKACQNLKNSASLIDGIAGKLTQTDGLYKGAEDKNTVAVSQMFNKLRDYSVGADPLSSYGDRAHFGDAMPADSIPAAECTTGIPQPFQSVLEFAWLSPTYWAMKIMEWGVGVDPISWVIERFMADWNGVGMAGNAFGHIADYWTELAEELQLEMAVLFRGWQGDAADSVQSYFRRFISAHAEQAPKLKELEAMYNKLSWSMNLYAQAVAGVVSMIIDQIAGAAIIAAAIVAATASGVGAPVAAALSVQFTFLLELIVGEWAWVLTVWGLVLTLCYMTASTILNYLATKEPIEQLTMPDEA